MNLEIARPVTVFFPLLYGPNLVALLALTVNLLVIDAVSVVLHRRIVSRPLWRGYACLSAMLIAMCAAFALALGVTGRNAAFAVGESVRWALEAHQFAGIGLGLVLIDWPVMRALAWWRGKLPSRPQLKSFVAVNAALALAIAVSAWFGSTLVEDYGVALWRTAMG